MSAHHVGNQTEDYQPPRIAAPGLPSLQVERHAKTIREEQGQHGVLFKRE